MSLSKKNLDKLDFFIKNQKLKENITEDNCDNMKTNHKNFNNLTNKKDPREIFYSLIDNAETLNETTEVNHLLKNSENDYIDNDSKKTNSSNSLTIEDELYDEFNYLLEE